MKKVYILSLLLLAFGPAHAQTPAYVAPDSLIGWYPFNGNANNAAYAGMLNGTVSGATLTTDRFGAPSSAYILDGNTNNITLDSAFFDVGWNNYSISCWVNSDTLNNPNNGNKAQAIFNTIPHNGLGLYFNWNYHGRNLILAGTPGSGWNILFDKHSSDSARIHMWKHLVLVKSGGVNYTYYVNGVQDTMHTGLMPAASHLCKMVLGRSDPGVISEGFFGKIDDYGIWQRALSACDVQRLYRSSAYLYLTMQPASVSTIPGSTVSFSVADTGTGNTYQWQVNSGSGFTDISAGAPYSGITTPTLTITGVTSAIHNNKYRCVVDGAMCADSSDFATLTVSTLGVGSTGRAAISVLPNPANNEVHITGADGTTVRIFDNTGRTVLEAEHTGRLSLAELPAALYIIELKDDKGKVVYRDKLLKQ